MGARKATLLVMAKMALSDGEVAQEERGFLQEMLQPGETVDALLAEAKGRSMKELVAPIDRYADRFFVALRAYAMSTIDMELVAREEAAFERLVTELAIKPSDCELIKRVVAEAESEEPEAPDPRVEELFQASSFV